MCRKVQGGNSTRLLVGVWFDLVTWENDLVLEPDSRMFHEPAWQPQLYTQQMHPQSGQKYTYVYSSAVWESSRLEKEEEEEKHPLAFPWVNTLWCSHTAQDKLHSITTQSWHSSTEPRGDCLHGHTHDPTVPDAMNWWERDYSRGHSWGPWLGCADRILSLDLGGGYMTELLCQNSHFHNLDVCAFYWEVWETNKNILQ